MKKTEKKIKRAKRENMFALMLTEAQKIALEMAIDEALDHRRDDDDDDYVAAEIHTLKSIPQCVKLHS